MKKTGPSLPAVFFAVALLTAAGLAYADAPSGAGMAGIGPVEIGPVELAQADSEAAPELQPRYEPAPPPPEGAYNDEYIFGLTRGIADSALHPVAKIVLFPITVPLDIALLPFEAIGGFF